MNKSESKEEKKESVYKPKSKCCGANLQLKGTKMKPHKLEFMSGDTPPYNETIDIYCEWELFCSKCGKMNPEKNDKVPASTPPPASESWESDLRVWLDVDEGGYTVGKYSRQGIIDFIRSLLSSQRTSFLEMVESQKKKLGASPLQTSGLSIAGAIQRDMEFREQGYIHQWDADFKLNQALEDIKAKLIKHE